MRVLGVVTVLALWSPLQGQEAPNRQLPADEARAVTKAVDSGIAWLRKQQRKDGSFRWTKSQKAVFEESVLGETALAVLAMLVCDVDRRDRAVEKAFAYILSQSSRQTYESALILMALDRKGAPPWEKSRLQGMRTADRRKYRFPRAFTPAEKERLVKEARILMEAQGAGYWSYQAKAGFSGDISNTQFAVLGLRAARRSGIQVPTEQFERLLQALMRSQELKGPDVLYKQWMDAPGQERPYKIRHPSQARGWGYWERGTGAHAQAHRTNQPGMVTGSRVCIGIASLALCMDEILMDQESDFFRSRSGYVNRVHDSIRDGLAWMQKKYSVTKNPGTTPQRSPGWPMHQEWYYYYMYAMERVGALVPTRYIGLNDWYQDGAREVVKRQDASGYWLESHPLVDTAFALLFLRRATVPTVLTGQSFLGERKKD